MFKMISLPSIILLASSLYCAVAQTDSAAATTFAAEGTSTASASSSTGTPKVHRVNVGAGGFMYDPNVTLADVGDIVTFVFYPTNHSVIRGEFTGSDTCGTGGCNPCVPYDMIHSGGGFNSTNVLLQQLPPATSISGTTQTFNITVNNTSPIWYYCDAIGSCHPNGMVGVINPGNGQDISDQKAAAIKAPYQLSPADVWPAEGVQIGAETATVSGLSQPTSSTTSNGTALTQDSTSEKKGLSGGAIAGIVIGGLAVIALAGALFYYVGRSKAYKDAFQSRGSEAAGNTSTTGEKSAHVAQWVQPPPNAPATTTSGYTDNRVSYMTQPPQAGHPSASFVGYNRNTGEPEFAAEAPVQRQQHQSWMSSNTSSPGMNQGPFQSTPLLHQGQAFEMQGDSPQRAEMSGR